MQPLILITNDDGIYSPGLLAAVRALAPLGELLIIAPSHQQSGKSRSLDAEYDGEIHQITLAVDAQSLPAYHLAGTPAQAVLYGVVTIAGRKPDLVVSGINFGENLGSNTLISGTVGAALQGADMGIPALAVSLEVPRDYHYNHGHDVDWSAAEIWAERFARQALTDRWPEDVNVLKIDIPANASGQTPWRITRQSRQSYYRATTRSSHNGTRALDYEIYIDYDTLEPDSDIYVFSVAREISVTPLSTNLTSRVSLPDLAAQLAPTLSF